jgi:predicted DNA-binding helix-hairpin-helix protein
LDTEHKLDLLGAGAQADLACGTCGEGMMRVRDEIGRWIYPAVRPDGHRVKMLKILQTNACERDCFYCATRRSRNGPRVTFQPEELARTFDEMHRARLVEAIFLSSGVAGGGTRTMERMLATAELLRKKFAFRGYLHLKLMPGADSAAIEYALRLADRVSVNLEAPSSLYLARLSATKRYVQELLAPLVTARRLMKADPRLARKTMTTQFVVGAAGESDREIAARASQLYGELKLSRVYYSAFQPIPDTPLDGLPATLPVRENRLYQSDFLLRQYGFRYDELVYNAAGNLPVEADPKTAWAECHPEWFPIEINRASKPELLRIPGIGPIAADRILGLRRAHRFATLEQLGQTGANEKRAAAFVLLDGHRPARQLTLW